MDFFELFLLTPGQLIDLINSNLFYVYAVPIFLALESGITYLYLKKIKTYKSIAGKKNMVMTFWAYMIIKMFFVVPGYPTACLAVEMGHPWDISAKFMIIYYLYSLGVCIAFAAYLVDKYLPSRSVKKYQDGRETSSGDILENAILYDVSEKIQKFNDDMPPCAGRTMRSMAISYILLSVVIIGGIIFFICGGFDKYFGINKTGNYHELGETIDSVSSLIHYVLIGLIASPFVIAAAIALHRRHKAMAEDPFCTGRGDPSAAPGSHSSPDDPSPQPTADQTPPRA